MNRHALHNVDDEEHQLAIRKTSRHKNNMSCNLTTKGQVEAMTLGQDLVMTEGQVIKITKGITKTYAPVVEARSNKAVEHMTYINMEDMNTRGKDKGEQVKGMKTQVSESFNTHKTRNYHRKTVTA